MHLGVLNRARGKAGGYRKMKSKRRKTFTFQPGRGGCSYC